MRRDTELKTKSGKPSLYRFSRVLVAILLLCSIALFFWLGLDSYLSFEYLKFSQERLQHLYETEPLKMGLAYFVLYVIATGLSIPGATVLTLAGGAIFGLVTGSLIISFASTIGATISFFLSRLLLRSWVNSRFGPKLRAINEGFARDGAFYLLFARLNPVFPFFLINLAMGLTPIRLSTYFVVSQLGMLPATLIYVNAGTELARIDSPRGLLSPGVFTALMLLSLFPLLAKAATGWLTTKRLYRGFRKPHRFDYDLVVIGAGSAGLVAANIASALKAKVALIEKDAMGGDCLNTGCVPSKTFLRSANVLHLARRAPEFGLKPVAIEADFSAVMERVRHAIRQIEPNDSIERYTKLGVTCLKADAKILSPFEVQAGDKVLVTRNIVIATGARPTLPKLKGLEKVPFYTSETIWSLTTQPRRLLILGGGAIGCELGQAFTRLGSQVTIVEKAPRLLSREDEDVSELLTERLRQDGAVVHTSFEAIEFESVESAHLLKARSTQDETEMVFEFDAVLIALGRTPRLEGLGLERLGLTLPESGGLQTDAYLRVQFPNIFACGDVVGPYLFTHAASHQAWFAAVNALFRPFVKFRLDTSLIPITVFTEPEIARVGLNEFEARARGIGFRVTRYPFSELDRAICDQEQSGFVKLLTCQKSDRILGATIVGARAGDLINEVTLAMKHGLGLEKILVTVHAYPTYAMALTNTAGIYKRANAPAGALKWLKRFHAWRRGPF